MRALRDLLGLPDRDELREPASLRQLVADLSALGPAQARYLGAFAFVLARVANADLEVSSAERARIAELVREHGGVDSLRAALVADLALALQEARGGTDNYVVTRAFRDLSTRAQRVELLNCLFAVAAADDSISERESTEVIKIGTELGFAREEVVGIRQRFGAQLDVLRRG